ncbi:Vacuolar protease A [Clonorchis sinensis]|uniref:Vacuolar protease A n=1 Tax=Clonorchis sinensis TaxID=79923 RepID=A0A419PC34_CLOSI|nr:Vacuolar protease A [Clonorchis sinensis]
MVSTAINPEALTHAVDGFIGLGPKGSNLYFEQTFMGYMAKQKIIQHQKFGFIFENKYGAVGQFVFGDHVETRVRGKLAYVPSISSTSWRLELSAILVGNQRLNLKDWSVVIDTAYKSVVLPMKLAKYINGLLGRTGTIDAFSIMDCDRNGGWPDITFVFGVKPFVLKHAQYLAKFIQNGMDCCVSLFSTVVPIKSQSIILGLAFISKFDTVFDLESMEVGFAVPEV